MLCHTDRQVKVYFDAPSPYFQRSSCFTFLQLCTIISLPFRGLKNIWRKEMDLESAKTKRGLAIGAVIGALLGAGGAYLLMTAPKEAVPGEDPDPITAGDIISLTGAAAVLIRKIDDFRRKA